MRLADIITPEELSSLLSEEEAGFGLGENLARQWGALPILTPYITAALQAGCPPKHVAGILRCLAYINENLNRKAVRI